MRDPITVAQAILTSIGHRDRNLPPDEELELLARSYLEMTRESGSPAHFFVSLQAAKDYAAARGFPPDRIETARRELSDVLIDARPSSEDPLRWKVRKHDLYVSVARERRLLVVTHAHAPRRK
jgi:hypothetical protein